MGGSSTESLACKERVMCGIASNNPVTQSLNSLIVSKAIIGAGHTRATRPVKGSTISENSSSPYSGYLGILTPV
tara:strand:+ start:438 stop:659 length:222 start_codon:yes stop_codon:yes gene_type:complete